jgi:hypothetical protein
VARGTGITEIGRIVQVEANASSLPQIQRSLVVRDNLFTVSDAGVKASTLATLANVGWAAFPTPVLGPGPKIATGAPSTG